MTIDEKTMTVPNGRAAQGALPLTGAARPRRVWALLAAAVFLLSAIAAGVYFAVRSRTSPSYVTVPVERRDLAQRVTATGTVNAQNTILVGTQVSGTIESIYVDFNSRVRRGQVLARLDPSQFEAQLAQARASLRQASAQAGAAASQARGAGSAVEAADATTVVQTENARASTAAVAAADAAVAKAQSADALARRTVARDRQLLPQGYIPQSQYDADDSSAVAAATALRSARASAAQTRAQARASRSQVNAGTAQAAQARSQAAGASGTAEAAAAAIQSARAMVQQDELNLSRTVITSPVDGTVVARNVSVGQTVAASFQTPTLFTIAQDLRKMEVDIGVGEPDIGSVRTGNRVSFTVLAYPNQTFHGIVSQVRANPTTVQNVVTYTVIILVDNKDGRLLPGMTANANIAVAARPKALVVPTQALTYRPASVPSARASASPATGRSPWGTVGAAAGAVVGGRDGVVYVIRDEKPSAVPVHVDLVSGLQAAVTPLGNAVLGEGDAVVTGDSASSRAQRSNNTNAPPGLGRMIH